MKQEITKELFSIVEYVYRLAFNDARKIINKMHLSDDQLDEALEEGIKLAKEKLIIK